MNKYLKKYINFNNYEEDSSNFFIPKDCPQDFINFLKNENIYEKFINNLLNNNNQWKWNFSKYCKDIKKQYYLSSSFRWYKTEEGDKFWRDINDKWRNLISK
jgi:hypothetical protein